MGIFFLFNSKILSFLFRLVAFRCLGVVLDGLVGGFFYFLEIFVGRVVLGT